MSDIPLSVRRRCLLFFNLSVCLYSEYLLAWRLFLLFSDLVVLSALWLQNRSLNSVKDIGTFLDRKVSSLTWCKLLRCSSMFSIDKPGRIEVACWHLLAIRLVFHMLRRVTSWIETWLTELSSKSYRFLFLNLELNCLCWLVRRVLLFDNWLDHLEWWFAHFERENVHGLLVRLSGTGSGSAYVCTATALLKLDGRRSHTVLDLIIHFVLEMHPLRPSILNFLGIKRLRSNRLRHTYRSLMALLLWVWLVQRVRKDTSHVIWAVPVRKPAYSRVYRVMPFKLLLRLNQVFAECWFWVKDGHG